MDQEIGKVVSDEAWLAARLELLQREKEFSRRRDELTALRRNLPWRQVKKNYTFARKAGEVTLAELFGDASQLLVYHFMFDPTWDEGCKICSMMADHYDPLVAHLAARDVTLVTVSRAPIAKIEAFRQKKGWSFTWVSSFDCEFNWDFDVSFTQEALDSGAVRYNYRDNAQFPVTEAPGISAFTQVGHEVFHTYSSYGRGLENFLGVYNFLDIVSKGRDEETLPYSMAWVQHKEQYSETS